MGTLLSKNHHVRPLLTQSTFLGRLPGSVIDALLGKGRLRSLVQGALAYRRGDPGDSLMVLTKGRIKLANTGSDGKEVVLHYVGVGNIFGEVAALDGKERAADAIALEDAEVFVVSTRDLWPILITHPDAMRGIVEALCEKIRAVAIIFEDNRLEMRCRIARGLLRLADQHGRITIGSAHLSQEELGKYLGISRQNINRQLGQLKIANVIRIKGKEIHITDKEGLADIAQVALQNRK